MSSLQELEDEVLRPLERQLESYKQSSEQQTRYVQRSFGWRLLFWAHLAFLLGAGAAGLYQLHSAAQADWSQASSNFQWLVLVEGNQVAIDEIGAYLKKIDGVQDVTFVSGEQMWESLKFHPVLGMDVSAFGDNPFPATWQVRWKNESLDDAAMEAAIQDIRSMPGVVDIAVDPAGQTRVKSTLADFRRLKFFVSFLSGIAVSLLFFAFVRLAFTPWRRFIDGKRALLGVTVTVTAFVSGFFALRWLW